MCPIRDAVRQDSRRFIRVDFSVQVPTRPVVRQGASIEHRSRLHIKTHGDIQVIQFNPVIPVLVEMVDDAHGESRRRFDDIQWLLILAAKRNGNSAFPAGGCLEGTTDGAGREVVDG